MCVLQRFAEILKNLLIIGKIGRNERRRDWGHADLREYKEAKKEKKQHKAGIGSILLRRSFSSETRDCSAPFKAPACGLIPELLTYFDQISE